MGCRHNDDHWLWRRCACDAYWAQFCGCDWHCQWFPCLRTSWHPALTRPYINVASNMKMSSTPHSRMASLIQTIMSNFVSYKKSWDYLLMKPQTCSKLATVKYLHARRFADSVAIQFYVRKTSMSLVAQAIGFPSSVRHLRTILFLACQGLLNYAVWQSQDHLL